MARSDGVRNQSTRASRLTTTAPTHSRTQACSLARKHEPRTQACSLARRQADLMGRMAMQYNQLVRGAPPANNDDEDVEDVVARLDESLRTSPCDVSGPMAG